MGGATGHAGHGRQRSALRHRQRFVPAQRAISGADARASYAYTAGYPSDLEGGWYQYGAALDQNVLGCTPDAPGLAWQLDALAHGLSRAQLLVNFSESAENLSLTGAYTKVGLFTSLYDPAYG